MILGGDKVPTFTDVKAPVPTPAEVAARRKARLLADPHVDTETVLRWSSEEQQ